MRRDDYVHVYVRMCICAYACVCIKGCTARVCACVLTVLVWSVVERNMLFRCTRLFLFRTHLCAICVSGVSACTCMCLRLDVRLSLDERLCVCALSHVHGQPTRRGVSFVRCEFCVMYELKLSRFDHAVETVLKVPRLQRQPMSQVLRAA